MKASIYCWSLYSIILSALLINNDLYSQALSGTYTIPGTINSTTVNNLTELATLLNAGTVSGTAIFEFTSSYSSSAEAYPVTFTQFGGTGNVIICPAPSVTTPLVTSGSPTLTALINLSGVKDLCFDGRPGMTGNRIHWAFENTGNGSEYPAFQFINGASSDTLQYLAIQSSCTNTTPTVLLSTSTVSGGNSNNVIQYDSIGNYSSLPYLAIGSFGTTGAYANAGNSILNNDIYNFQGYYTSYNGAGIYVSSTGNGSNWNISNNSFYATSTLLSGCVMPICFLPGSSSTGNTISNNYIGGQAPLCGGTPWKQWGDEGGVSWPPDFIGLYSDAGNVAISNNTVQNLAFGGGGADFYYSPSAICMYVVGGNANVNNNLIGSDSIANSVLNGWGGLLIGISNSSSGAVTINDNTVANLTQNYTLTAGSEIYSPIMGIYCYGDEAESDNQLGANTITNNKVYNISSIYGGGVENQYYPINSAYSSYNPDGVFTQNPIAGIYLQTSGSATQIISKNIVYGLNINVSSGGDISAIYGIVMNAGSGTNIVNANLVYGLWVPDTYGSSNNYSGLVGIYLPTGNAGTYTVTNNMIDLGFKSTDSSTVQNVYIFGIWDDNDENNSGTLNYDIYHNSIYIGGTYNNTYSNALPSYGIARYFNWGSSVYENVKLYNNIIYNNRSGAGSNYGIYTESAAIDWASNYNLVYGTGTNFTFGNSAGTNYTTQAEWNTATTMDANTLTSNPLYDEPTGLSPNLHVQSTSPINAAGTASFTIVYDFDSLIRANYTPVDIGAAVVGSCSPVIPTVTLSPSATTICQGTTVNFTTTETNGGTGPTYDFYVDGVSKQNTTTSTFSSTTLNNGDSVWVVMTSDAACASPTTATSTKTYMVVNPTVTPAVTISPSATTICQGTSVNFTTIITNGGAAPTYDFYVDGVSKQSGATTSYSSTTLNNNDSIWVVITSNAACASPTTATSTHVKMVVNPTVTPAVTISPSANNICAGTSVTFTTTITNGGASPTYDFYVDGVSKQNNTTTSYSSSTLNNGDSVWVVITSDAACASPTTATSTKVYMVVNPLVTPSVTISPSASTICQGASVNFTTTETNGGTGPIYDFYVDGVSKQNTSTSSFSSTTLNNDDSVWVVITSDASCTTTATATSTKVHMVVNPLLTPTVTISPSTNNICQGTSVNFTTTETNGGASPTYDFYVDGVSKQSGATTSYPITTLNNGDSVWVVLTSNATCASPTTATSTKAFMVVNPLLTPSVTISPSENNICSGTPDTFTTTITNGGASPIYDFYVDGVSKQNGATASYSSSILNNNDSVWVVITSDATCASPSTATSTKIHMTVNATVAPTVTITPSATTICQGTTVNFTTTETNGGTSPTYNFFVDGVSKHNSDTSIYSTGSLNNGDSVWVVMTSSSACASPTTATSTHVKMVVNPLLTPSVTISPSVNNVCQGTAVNFTTTETNGGTTPTYNFFVDGISKHNSDTSAYSSSTLNNGDSVWVVITSNATCASPVTDTSAHVIMVINAPTTPTVSLSSANNICQGADVTFKANPTSGGAAPTYDFYVNGVSKQNNTDSIYSSSTLNNGDSVWVVMKSNATCVTTTNATSAKTKMVVNPLVTPTVSISPDNNYICPGNTVNFNTGTFNGGSSPVFDFYVNGVDVQNGPEGAYTTDTLNNNDSVWVVLISSHACASPDTVASAKVGMTVYPVVVPAVSISPSVNNICQGTSVNFTTSQTNGNPSPTYQFFVDGVSKQNGVSATFTSSTLNNNDSVWVVMTSGADCPVPPSATSNKTTMVVNPLVPTEVTIAPSQNYVCPGTAIIFTATGTNGGTLPTYDFFVDGVSKQNDTSGMFSTNTLNNNDSVWVVMKSNISCPADTTATSSHVHMVISSSVVPVVSIATTGSHTCQGIPVTFTTSETGGGSAPVYNFMQNGVSVQNDTSGTFVSSSLNNNDSVWVVMTSNSACASPDSATSNKVYMTVNQPAASSFSASRCEGVPYFFKGTNIYQTGTYLDTLQTINGCDSIVTLNYTAIAAVTVNVPDTICRGASYDFYGQVITATGRYLDTLTATITGCDSIVIINMYVPSQPVVTLTGPDTLTAGVYRTYQWLLNDTAIQGATTQQYVAVRNGDYKVAVTGVKACEDTSTQVALTTLGINNLADNARIDLYPNPTTGELKINIAGLSPGPVTIHVVDVYGQQVLADSHVMISDNYNSILNLSTLPAGVYFISVQSANESYTRQVEVIK